MGENYSCAVNARNYLRKYVEKAEARVWRKGGSVLGNRNEPDLFIEPRSFSLLSVLTLVNLPIFPASPLPCSCHRGSSGCRGRGY